MNFLFLFLLNNLLFSSFPSSQLFIFVRFPLFIQKFCTSPPNSLLASPLILYDLTLYFQKCCECARCVQYDGVKGKLNASHAVKVWVWDCGFAGMKQMTGVLFGLVFVEEGMRCDVCIFVSSLLICLCLCIRLYMCWFERIHLCVIITTSLSCRCKQNEADHPHRKCCLQDVGLNAVVMSSVAFSHKTRKDDHKKRRRLNIPHIPTKYNSTHNVYWAEWKQSFVLGFMWKDKHFISYTGLNLISKTLFKEKKKWKRTFLKKSCLIQQQLNLSRCRPKDIFAMVHFCN